MSNEQNEARLTGTVDRIRPIATKTGSTMCEIILKVRADKFRITAFKNLADYLLGRAAPGDPLSITGTIQASSWKNDAGEWQSSFSITAWSIELHGEKVVHQKGGNHPCPVGKPATNHRAELPTVQSGDYF